MIKPVVLATAALIVLTLSSRLSATEEPHSSDKPEHLARGVDFPEEPYNSGWSFSFDNDVIVDAHRDQDYTGGTSLAKSGRRAQELWWSVDKLRAGADRIVQFPRLYESRANFKRHTIESGLLQFTPSELEVAEPLFDDYPYASLFFITNSEQTIVPSTKTSYTSAMTVGLLGTSLGGDVQVAIHKLIGAARPRGWSNQISDGGEPTFEYTTGLQKTVVDSQAGRFGKMELKLTGEANVGMTTDVGVGFNFRIGRLSTPWWSFNPHQGEYANLNAPTFSAKQPSGVGEIFLYFGGTVKLRAYNAILQGQFRDSAVTFSRSELNTAIREAWVGASYEFKNGLTVSSFLRTRSAEINLPGFSEIEWGGLVFSKAFQ